MTELLPQADGPVRLTPRQDRIEQSLARLLRRQATRSEIREVVYQYADLHRLQGVPPDRAVGALQAVVQGALAARATQASGSAPEGTGLPADLMPLILRWYASRYDRGAAVAVLADVKMELAP
jgi:hypothetical protein